MSSNQLSNLRRPRSLRAKLIVQLVGVVAVVCLILSITTEIALHSFLIGQLDRQLVEASHRATGPGPGPGRLPPLNGGKRPPIYASGQGPGTVVATLVAGTVRDAQRLNTSGEPEDLQTNLYPVLTSLPVGGGAVTKSLGDLGDYRLTAVQAEDGDIVITGLPLSIVDATLLTVGLILGGISLIALGAAWGGGTFIVRRTLRPLQRVAATAGRVAELPLDRGEVALSVRVPESDTDPRTEVGQVGSALNRMLGHIGNALEARHASETRMRRFIADASHELRTPLAAIRGYAELTRRSHDEVPADVRHAMSRVESESARMTTLVEDL